MDTIDGIKVSIIILSYASLIFTAKFVGSKPIPRARERSRLHETRLTLNRLCNKCDSFIRQKYVLSGRHFPSDQSDRISLVIT